MYGERFFHLPRGHWIDEVSSKLLFYLNQIMFPGSVCKLMVAQKTQILLLRETDMMHLTAKILKSRKRSTCDMW